MSEEMNELESSDAEASDGKEPGGVQVRITRSKRLKKTVGESFLELFQQLRMKLLNQDYYSDCIRLSLRGNEYRILMFTFYPRRTLALLVDIQ